MVVRSARLLPLRGKWRVTFADAVNGSFGWKAVVRNLTTSETLCFVNSLFEVRR
jgi:hypothetical protein